MSEPERIGFLDGPPKPRPSWCGGALLFVDLEQFRAMARNGFRWAIGESAFRSTLSNGMGHARVYCSAPALRTESVGAPRDLPEGVEASPSRDVHVTTYALCAACSSHEAHNRQLRRERHGGSGGR